MLKSSDSAKIWLTLSQKSAENPRFSKKMAQLKKIKNEQKVAKSNTVRPILAKMVIFIT